MSTADAWRPASVTLLLTGGAAAVGVLPGLASGGQSAGILGNWLAGLLITIAFAVLWLCQRVKAGSAGVARPAGFGAAALAALLVLVVGADGVFIAGPFLVFGVGLLVLGWMQRNRLLVIWALAAGGLGVFEGFFGITNRLSLPLWQPWEHPAIFLVIALATVLAGIMTWRRETRARWTPPSAW